MLFDKKLKRKQLVNIAQEFYKNYQNEKDIQKKKQKIRDLLLSLEQCLNKSELKRDDRFFTYCRRDFLRQEFTDKLNKKNIKLNNDYLLDAYFNLYDYIVNDTWISMGSIPNDISAQDVIKKDDEYKNSGIICFQEKEILLDMIHELREAIDKSDVEDPNNYNLEKDINVIDDVTDNNVICPYCNSNEVWEYLYGEPTYDYNRDKYVLGGCELDFTKTHKCKKCNKDFKNI